MGDASMVWRTRNEGLFLRIGAFLAGHRLSPDPEHYRLVHAILRDSTAAPAIEAARLTAAGVRLGLPELEALAAMTTAAPTPAASPGSAAAPVVMPDHQVQELVAV